MTKPKEFKPIAKKVNPIEEAIGERAKDPKAQETFTKEYQTEPTPVNNSLPTDLDEPSPSEMLLLEELNRQTEERFQDQYPEEKAPAQNLPKLPIPALKPDLPPATETKDCSQESPPQEIDASSKQAFEITKNVKKSNAQTLQEVRSGAPIEAEKTMAELLGQKLNEAKSSPAEDIALTALRDFIMGSGFVVAGVAMHIVALCSQPMVTPSTTTWDFKGRASIPDMVFSLLRQPGYLEGIWPSLKVVMGSNRGNEVWTAGIATSIAYFDIIRTLPTVKEMENEVEKKS